MLSNLYTNYLKSNEWQSRRQSKLRHAKERCEQCGEREGLQVHHLNYERLGREADSDLIVLCKSCHWIADIKRIDQNNVAVLKYSSESEHDKHSITIWDKRRRKVEYDDTDQKKRKARRIQEQRFLGG